MKHWRATFDDREHENTWSEIIEAPGETEAWGKAAKMTISPEMIEKHGRHVTVLSVALYREIMGPNRYGVAPLSQIQSREVSPESPCGICGRKVDVILYYGVVTPENTWGTTDEDGERQVIDVQCHRRFAMIE